MARRTRRRAGVRDSRRIAGALGLVGLTATVGVRAASGTFSASQAVNSGTVDTGRLQLTIADGDTNAPIQAFNVSFANVYPNYTAQRLINVTNGDTGFASLSLSIVDNCVSGTPCVSDEITTNTAKGLQVLVQHCSQAWEYVSGASPTEQYACNGTTTNVTVEVVTPIPDAGYDPIVGSWTMPGAVSLSAGATNHYRFMFKLPDSALDSMQNESARVRVAFTGTQRAGTNK